MSAITAFFLFSFLTICHECLGGVDMFFPEAWDGDKYNSAPCVSKNIPQWIDGYLFVQMAASYGKQSEPLGKKLVHLFDGINGVSSFELSNGQVKFSAKYYPSRTYSIWNFYNRNMSSSYIAWMPMQSPWNVSADEMWQKIPLADGETFQLHNTEFWRVGPQVLSATESIGLGMTFDPATLGNFKMPQFKDTSDIFKPGSPIVPLTLAAANNDGLTYGVSAAYDPVLHKMYQIVWKIERDFTRSVEGQYETGEYDPTKCTSDGRYTGDKNSLVTYMHSIGSTRRYLVLPLTSMYFNPCRLPPLNSNLTIDRPPHLPPGLKQPYEVLQFADEVPLKFLVFDKTTKEFVTKKPIQISEAMTVGHQFNSYEDDDGTLVVDFDTIIGDLYGMMTLEQLAKGVGKRMRFLRFRINLSKQTAEYTNLLNGQDVVDGEFPNFNPNYAEKKYKYGYMMSGFLIPSSKISKIDMDAKRIVGEFSAPGSKAHSTVYREPVFVPRPGAVDEDDGVVLTLGGDINSLTSTLYVIDGKTMRLTGSAEIPTVVPQGLHNRFFFKNELGVSSSSPRNNEGPQSIHHEALNRFEQAYWQQRQGHYP